MPRIHDPAFRASIERRLASLTPASPRQWGTMSVDQMLRHVNIALESALGRVAVARLRVPLPGFILKWMVLYLPWPRGSPTAPEFIAGDRYDFEAERARCLALVNEVAGRSLSGEWPYHHTFGRISGAEASALQAKHLDHHLRQFGA
ncbi:MAG TPA: hypothetical protein VFO55_10435 [Gemmatimonadaceae bacterium]|nr:hypothetical protein [Gemmatimonadaceae bacterium]